MQHEMIGSTLRQLKKSALPLLEESADLLERAYPELVEPKSAPPCAQGSRSRSGSSCRPVAGKSAATDGVAKEEKKTVKRRPGEVGAEGWQWRDVNWPMFVLMAAFHLLAVVGAVLLCSHPARGALAFEALVIWYPVSGMLGITAGAHRLWSHRSYQAGLPARIIMMVANSIANQGTIYHWSRDHRVHHAKSDTTADPHDITRGFFFAHMGWLLLKKHPAVKEAGKAMDMSDLLKDPVVRIQHACDPWWNLFFSFGLPALWGHYVYDDALVAGFLVIGCLRWIVCLHATWCVNSVAHTFGDRPYTSDMWPSQSWFTTFFAVGEGYHNWHHTYPYDYSASELGWFQCFNPTTLWIDGLAAIGQVWGRKRAKHGVTPKCGHRGVGCGQRL